jgi:hypothetical protein
MIKHVVVWKLAESAEGADKATNALKMKRMLESLRNTIPEIQKIEVGLNCNSKEIYDVALYAEFKCMDDVHRYQEHPDHKACVEFIRKVRKDRVAIDYEI